MMLLRLPMFQCPIQCASTHAHTDDGDAKRRKRAAVSVLCGPQSPAGATRE